MTIFNIKKISKILLIFNLALALSSLILLIPQFQNFLILQAELLLKRSINHDIWHTRLIEWEHIILFNLILFIVFFLIFSFAPYPIFTNNSKGIFNSRNTFSKIYKSRTHGLELFLILILLLCVRFFFISQKKTMHVDEGLSISICNRNEYGFWGKTYEKDKQYTGKEIKEMSLWNDDSIKDSLIDIFFMHQDNRDSPHTNLYYSLLRLWFTGVKTCNLKYIYWRGCLLNVLFFIITFIFYILLLYKFTNNKIIISFSLLLALLNPASLSLTVFLRPYELQQTFIIILTYYVVCNLNFITFNEFLETKKNFVIGVFVLALTMLSAYFNFFLVGLFGLFLIILAMYKKNYNLLYFYIFMFIASLFVARVLYFKFGNMGDRALEASTKLSLSTISQNFNSIFNGIKNIFNNNFFFGIYNIILVIYSLIIIFYTLISKEHIKDNFIINSVLVVGYLSIFLILYFAPLDLKNLRYIAPIYPILPICFIGKIKNSKFSYITTIITLLPLFLSLTTIKNKTAIEHLDDANLSNYKELQSSSLPIFIRGESPWRYSSLIPYISDDSKVIFISNYSDINKYSNIQNYIFINQKDDTTTNDFNYESFNLKKLNSCEYHDFYIMKN